MNDAYLQQFLERRAPRELPEWVRFKLAVFLGISQDKLNPDPWQLGNGQIDSLKLLCVCGDSMVP